MREKGGNGAWRRKGREGAIEYSEKRKKKYSGKMKMEIEEEKTWYILVFYRF